MGSFLMRALILAAGKGSRLNGNTSESPKCMTKLGNETLIGRQIRMLRHAGVRDIAVVTGCQAGRVRAACGQGITYVENTKYAQTNSLYSLWMARPLLFEGFVVLNCDVLFHPALLRDLLTSRHDNALLIDYRGADQPPYGDEEMKVHVRHGCVRDMSKDLPADEADGENLGIVKFGADGAAALVDIMDRIIAEGADRAWAPFAFREFAQDRPLHAIGTRGLPWIEIDFPEDYRRAVHEVLPLIEADPSVARGTADAAPLAPPLAGFGAARDGARVGPRANLR
jgi:L-glutamine-phosphate cytidylyltransferase